MSFIWDTCSELLNFLMSFVKTMFRISLDTQNRWPGRPAGGVGRAPATTAPSANNIEADLLQAPSSNFFESIATTVIWDHGNVHFVNDAEEWQIEVNKAKATGKVIVAKFFATWCSPCKSMAFIFVELSKKIGHQLVFLKIDIEAVSDVAAMNEVRSMPTFLFIRDGQQIDKIVGANKQELVIKCNQYATSG